MKNKFTVLKVRKNVNFFYFCNHWGKNSCKTFIFFYKYEELLAKNFLANRSNFRRWSLKGYTVYAAESTNRTAIDIPQLSEIIKILPMVFEI